MVEVEELKKLPYEEQLKVLMEKAREEKDIWMMLVIHDEIKALEGTKTIPS